MIDLLAHHTDLWRALATHLWQSTLVIVPILVLARLMRRAPAGVVHALYTLGLVKLLLPLAIFGSLASSLLAAWAGSEAAVGGLGRVTVLAVTTVLAPGDYRSCRAAGETGEACRR